MVIPEFGPCGGEADETAVVNKKDTSGKAPGKKKGGPSLTSSDLPAKSKKAKKKAAIAESMMNENEKQLIVDLNLEFLDDKQIKVLINEGKICFKCRFRVPNYSSKQDKVCKVCFMDSMIHRFKMSLRLNLKIWKDDLNLICISGGSSSMALLDLMHDSLFGTSS